LSFLNILIYSLSVLSAVVLEVIMIIKTILFVILSAGILSFSCRFLRDPRSHGFFRFFAFEFLLLLILLNVDHWFADPFSLRQILSWLLLFSSLVLAIHGWHLLIAMGRPKGGFENTTTLVLRGAYKYVRHPLYASLLLLGWGTFFKDPSLLGGSLALVISAFLIAMARVEEAENLEKFGSEYARYMKSTRMFIPFLF
jgi:protein-S-isoprenylcysteine O-methyltransferase Ste14